MTLYHVLVHVTTETCRHAGHADIVRELVDGQVGYANWGSNIPEHDNAWWHAYRDRVEDEAGRSTGLSQRGRYYYRGALVSGNALFLVDVVIVSEVFPVASGGG